MRVKRKVAIAIALGVGARRPGCHGRSGRVDQSYNTPVSYDMIFGSSGNIYDSKTAPSSSAAQGRSAGSSG